MLAVDKLQLIQTKDGSHTLQLSDSLQTFRSTQGARTESQYVFVDGSQIQANQGLWTVLELGLGTGLNFANTVKAFVESPHADALIYHSVEQSPLPISILHQVFPTLEAISFRATDILANVLTLFETGHSINQVIVGQQKAIQLHLHPMPWQKTNINNLQANAYYHDPFAPNDNPKCWTTDCFKWGKAHLAPNGKLVTYGAASQTRHAMAQAGLFMAKRKGSGSKREMTVAAHHPDVLRDYKLLSNSKQPANVIENHEL